MTAIRPRLDMEDSFFERGNELSLSDCCFAYVEYKVDDDGEASQKNHNDEDMPCYECNSKGCNFLGSSIQECEDHYMSKHVFECNVCHKNMPNPYLLDAHIEETHDSYFQSMLDRHQAVYKCLVEYCTEKFSSDEERYRHLVTHHDYPSWFRFHSKLNQTKMRLNRKFSSQQEDISTKTKGGNDPVIDSECERKMRRSARRKLRNENIPCRFYNTKRGCRRGDKCMFLHEDNPNDARNDVTVEQNKSDVPINDEDLVMEDLANELSSLQVFVPSQISFGRRRR